jgi:hypothetical protein
MFIINNFLKHYNSFINNYKKIINLYYLFNFLMKNNKHPTV